MRPGTAIAAPYLAALLWLIVAGVADAAELPLAPTQCGHDEREEGTGACRFETAFKAGVPTAAAHLKAGGEAAGCNSEWAACFEFDLGPVPSGAPVDRATLIVRKTGYSDDAQGFAYLGIYAYAPTGAEIAVEREDLTPDNALDIVYPPAANIDLGLDVTAAVTACVSAGIAKVGLLLAPVYSEIGYEDWISVGGCAYTVPPRLVVAFQGAVGAESTTWSGLKARYR
jgi:hypothetical protein